MYSYHSTNQTNLRQKNTKQGKSVEAKALVPMSDKLRQRNERFFYEVLNDKKIF